MATGRIPGTSGSPLTAKGDIFAYSTTASRLPVGSDGQTLVADSSTSTGLRYTAGNPIPNPVLNSAMQVWQRGTTFALSNTQAYTADRWQGRVSTTCTTSFSRQATGDTTNLPNIQYSARVQRSSGQTATPFMILEQSIESVNSIPFAGKTVTMSFYARAGANFSASSNNLSVYLLTGTGTDQNVASGFTGSVNSIVSTATLTTTWQRFTYTATLQSNITQIGTQVYYVATGTAGAADYYEITGWQIDIGSVALPFRTNAATIQGELAACQRYYQMSYNQGVTPGTTATLGYIALASISTGANANFFSRGFAVSMRTTPTIVTYSDGTGATGYCRSISAASDVAASSYGSGASGVNIYVTGAPSGAVGYLLAAHYTASAEL